MTRLHRQRPASSVSALVVAFLVALTALSPAPAQAAPASAAVTCAPSVGAPSEGGVDMSATIIGPSTSPCDAGADGGAVGGGLPTGAGGFAGARSPGSSSVSTGTTGSSGVDTTAEPTPEISIDEVDLGGVLHVGGLSGSYQPSLNPFGGDLELAFTVRNVSKSTIEATADFWMEGPFGNRVSAADGIRVADLRPGETRTVSASLPGVGQWTILSAHATFRPPSVVDETELSPLTRDSTAFALPWFFVLLTALGLATVVIVQAARRREVAQPIGAFA